MALARDAQSSGDPVLAENYLQHAEHYGRIIMAYREQLSPAGEAGMNGNGQRMRGPGDMAEGDDFGEDDGDQAADDGFSQPFSPQQTTHSQPSPPRNEGGSRHEGGGRHDRPFRRDQGRSRDRFARDRGERGERNGMSDRPMEGRPQVPPQDRVPEPPAEAGGDRRRDRMQQPHEQPEFLRRPVRRARSENDEPKDELSGD